MTAATAENLEPQPARVLLMHGSYDTLKNQAGAEYASVSLAEIEAMAEKPACAEKLKAPCAIFSTYLSHDGRTHKVQGEIGEYIALPGDIDQGDPHIAEVDAAIVAVYGDVRRLIYSTSGAKPTNRKWRYIIPLAAPIPGEIYASVQRAAFDLMQKQGITCDGALSRPGQVSYLPNVPKDRRDGDGVPLFYDWMPKGTELFSASGSAVEARMIEMQRADEEARAQAQAQARARADRRRTTHTGTLPNVIDAFNAATSIEDLLQAYGYQRKGNDWRSPHQQSGSYATRVMDGNAWVSMSESDVAAGLGTPIPTGGCWGDAFDLFKHYDHNGNHSDAMAAAAKSIVLSDGRTLDQARWQEWKAQQQGGDDVKVDYDELLGKKNQRKEDENVGTDDKTPPPVPPITLEELNRARLTPRVILRDLLYADVRTRISAGGAGKTTLALFEAVTLALGRQLYGRVPSRPCRTVIVTREDSREILVARLREIMQAMDLEPGELLLVLERILVIDKSGEAFRLSQVIADVVVPHHGSIIELIEMLAEWAPDWIIFDPLVSFGVGESRVNDAEQGLIEAFRILRNRLDCCVEGIHHSGKANAREKTLDQYSGRGGSALADGSRMVVVMQPLNAGEWLQETGSRLLDDENGIVMALPKLSYAKPQDSIFIRRKGYAFVVERVQRRTPEQAKRETADQVLRFLVSEYQQDRRYCMKDLENSVDQMNLTRAEVRAALTTLKVSGRVIYVEVKGKSGSHFAPVTLADDDGETPPGMASSEAES
jgi:RecA-family ATPase